MSTASSSRSSATAASSSSGGDELAEVDRHWTAHYGSSPLSWGDVVMYRLDPSWMVGYAWKRDELLAERGVTV